MADGGVLAWVWVVLVWEGLISVGLGGAGPGGADKCLRSPSRDRRGCQQRVPGGLLLSPPLLPNQLISAPPSPPH